MRFENILVIGGGGFIGRQLVAALAAEGLRVTVPTRRAERAKPLILLPSVTVVQARVRERDDLARFVRGHDAVINLVGVLHSRRGRRDERGPNDYGPDFAQAHVELPQAIVAACRAAGVRRLLHMSALGAAPDAPSEYLRSKGIGEQVALAAEDLDVTVFRPSVVFGPEDGFLNLFARLSRFFPVLPVACPEARFQPVYVGDVARAFVAALGRGDARGASYDLCGPRRYSLRELVRCVCAITGRRRLVLGLPDALARAQAAMFELLPGTPLLSRDNLRSMSVPSVCDATFPFGIEPQTLEALAPLWLAPPGSLDRRAMLRERAGR